MNRKDFLRLISLTSVSMCLHGFASPGNGSKKKVIVVGAGMAGAGAARMLKDNGCEVMVIEARDRVGGRMWSDKSLGTTLDLGAGWIEESFGNPVNKLAQKFGIKTIVSNFDSVNIYNSNGKLIDEEKASEIYRASQRFLRKALRYGNSQPKDTSYQDCLDHCWLDVQMDEELKKMVKWRISTEEINAATEYSKLSSWGETEKGFSGDYLIVPNGYAEIPEKLLQGIEIDLNSPVLEIIDHQKEVEVVTNKKSYKADHVILTLPLSVLKQNKIKISPALSDPKNNAINTLQMGNMNKLAIQFPEVFWGTDKHFIGCISENYGEYPTFVNWAYYGNGEPYLLATMGSAFSEKLHLMNDEERLKHCNAFLKKYFPQAPDAIKTKFSGWKWQEFSGGSYSFLPAGAKEELRDALAEPHGRIHFAGEATIKGYQGTVHGALLSGQREADRILAY